MPIRAFSISLLTIAALCACGLRGPLYLPNDKQTANAEESPSGEQSGKSRRPAPAPQSQKRDRKDEAPAGPTTTDPDRPANIPTTPPGN